MADEERKHSEEEFQEEVVGEHHGAAFPSPDGDVVVNASPAEEGAPVTPEYRPLNEEAGIPATGDALVDGSAAMLEETAEAAVENPAVQAYDHAVKDLMVDWEENADAGVDFEHEHAHSDTFTIPYLNTTMTLPGGIYTFIFVVLAALTVFEVFVAEAFGGFGVIATIVLVVASLAKAFLVVTYYMHLNTDSRIFRLTLIIPLIIVILSILYLVGVPDSTGFGYS